MHTIVIGIGGDDNFVVTQPFYAVFDIERGLQEIELFVLVHDFAVKKGHVYILQTPLFRVRDKKETRYCYTDQERIEAIKYFGENAEITRFKGLGEISPDEFKGFIGENIRLDQVTLRKEDSVKELLEFYMGKNTMERQNFIIDNLIVDDEDL